MIKIIIQQDPQSRYHFTQQDFDPELWNSRNTTKLLEGGRSYSQKIIIEEKNYVLRQYLRGGLMAKLLTDKYLWTGLSRSRPHQEQKVTEYAAKQGLPVARVTAYCIKKQGLFYRSSIISQYIENQGTLAFCLFTRELSQQDWCHLGQIIRCFHDAGIYHADLNANNILVDKQHDFHLIDFDKARVKKTAGSWQQQNLQRLQRSLNKIKAARQNNHSPFHFNEDNWQALVSGYR